MLVGLQISMDHFQHHPTVAEAVVGGVGLQHADTLSKWYG